MIVYFYLRAKNLRLTSILFQNTILQKKMQWDAFFREKIVRWMFQCNYYLLQYDSNIFFSTISLCFRVGWKSWTSQPHQPTEITERQGKHLRHATWVSGAFCPILSVLYRLWILWKTRASERRAHRQGWWTYFSTLSHIHIGRAMRANDIKESESQWPAFTLKPKRMLVRIQATMHIEVGCLISLSSCIFLL